MNLNKEVAIMIGEINDIIKDTNISEDYRGRIIDLCVLLSTISFNAGCESTMKVMASKIEDMIENDLPTVN